MLKQKTLFVILMIICCATTHAALVATGTVRDSRDQNPIQGALLEYVITNDQNRIVDRGSVRTDANGSYRVDSNIRQGMLIVRARKEHAYMPTELSVINLDPLQIVTLPVLPAQAGNFRLFVYAARTFMYGGANLNVHASYFRHLSDNFVVGNVVGHNNNVAVRKAFDIALPDANLAWNSPVTWSSIDDSQWTGVVDLPGGARAVVGKRGLGGPSISNGLDPALEARFPRPNTDVNGINNQLVVVGESNQAAMIFEDGMWGLLGVLPGGRTSEATGINNNKVIVGTSTNLQNQRKPFVIPLDFSPIAAPQELNRRNTWPIDISDRGTIIGLDDNNGGSVFWRRTGFNSWSSAIELTGCGAVVSEVRAINSHDVMVGASLGRAVLWDAYGYFCAPLADHISLQHANDYSLMHASGINDNGVIIGLAIWRHQPRAGGNRSYGFILVPPSPLAGGAGALIPPRAAMRVNGKGGLQSLEVMAGAPVQFDASESHDEDGKIIHYRWNLEQEGSKTESIFSSVIQHQFDQPGSYVVFVTVTDNDGLNDIGIVQVNVKDPSGQNWPPQVVAQLDYPYSLYRSLRVRANKSVPISAYVNDDDFSKGLMRWEQISGPDEATFSKPAEFETQVIFPTPGVYVLRINAFDGEHEAYFDLQVEVDEELELPVEE